MTAWVVYVLATLGALVMLNVLTNTRVSIGLRYSVLFLLAGLALAPAYPDETGATWAPAVFVAAFNFLIDGIEQAMPGLRSLAAGLGLGAVIALLFYVGRRLRS